jgi:hypothetical protein
MVPRAAFDADAAARIDAMVHDGGPHPVSDLELATTPLPRGTRHFVGRLSLGFGEYRRIYQAASGGRAWTTRALIFAGPTVLTLLVWPIRFGGAAVALTVGALAVVGYDVGLLRRWSQVRSETREPWRYDITETRIVVRTPYADKTFRWDVVAAARSGADAWRFTLRDGSTIPIPKAAFQPSESAHIDLLIDYWSLAAPD